MLYLFGELTIYILYGGVINGLILRWESKVYPGSDLFSPAKVWRECQCRGCFKSDKGKERRVRGAGNKEYLARDRDEKQESRDEQLGRGQCQCNVILS